jgi:hypothetical protein
VIVRNSGKGNLWKQRGAKVARNGVRIRSAAGKISDLAANRMIVDEPG